jgi:hypothetical protein
MPRCERRESQASCRGSKPARSTYALTICAALKADSRTACTRWPFSTGGHRAGADLGGGEPRLHRLDVP